MSSADTPTGRNIPLSIQRAVRQRCGFGCVVCGLPLYEYDHLLGWANVHRHEADEIILLCDQHHREKTSGLLTQQQVEAASANPYNHRSGVSKPYDLHFGAQECTIEIGSNVFRSSYAGYGTIMAPLVIDGIPVLGFVLGDDHLLLNFVLFDEYNKPILQIQNNALIYSVSPWDIELVGKRLRVRERARSFLLDVVFNPPSTITIERARFMLNGVEILVRPDHVLILNGPTLIRGSQAEGAQFGFVLGNQDVPGSDMIRIRDLNRYLGDRSEVLAWERESLGR